MEEKQNHVPVEIIGKFLPLYATAQEAPTLDDGSQRWMVFNEDAEPIDEESGEPIPREDLHLYGHKRRRIYTFFGGRGAGKSMQMFLIAILEHALKKPYTILCCRELQTSLKESSYSTIKGLIERLGLEDFFTFVEHEIRCKHTGGKFTFKGLRSSPGEIKSMDGIGLCLVDEALAVSEESWDMLQPTIRLDDSEIWMSMNVETPDDYSYRRFVLDADHRSYVFKVNIQDNPLVSKTLREDMEADWARAVKSKNFEKYNKTWLGIPMAAMSGGIFLIENIRIVPAAPSCIRWCRGYDLASSAVSVKNPDPDFTASVKMGVTQDGIYVISDVTRIRETSDVVERAIINTASQDGSHVPISIAQDPGGAGKFQAQYLVRKLSGYTVHTSPESGSKATRAGPFSSQCNVSNVVLVAGDWNQAFLKELKSFNGEEKQHDDMVDAASRSFAYLQTPYIMQQVEVRGL